jgi:predicted HAD superfamily phosphohydrolase YqeG
LFPISYDYDIEDDPTLPKVSPPYLPSKRDPKKVYTLVLDLDETLIHYEEVDESHEFEGEVFYMVRPGVAKFL